MEPCFDETSSSSTLPTLVDNFITFDQQSPLMVFGGCDQVPCFSTPPFPNLATTPTHTPSMAHESCEDKKVIKVVLNHLTKTSILGDGYLSESGLSSMWNSYWNIYVYIYIYLFAYMPLLNFKHMYILCVLIFFSLYL